MGREEMLVHYTCELSGPGLLDKLNLIRTMYKNHWMPVALVEGPVWGPPMDKIRKIVLLVLVYNRELLGPVSVLAMVCIKMV